MHGTAIKVTNGMLEGSVQRRFFGPKMEKLTRDCRKLHNKMLRDIFSLSRVIKQITLRAMRRTGHAVLTREKRNAYSTW